jgi:hypothetical protein
LVFPEHISSTKVLWIMHKRTGTFYNVGENTVMRALAIAFGERMESMEVIAVERSKDEGIYTPNE